MSKINLEIDLESNKASLVKDGESFEPLSFTAMLWHGFWDNDIHYSTSWTIEDANGNPKTTIIEFVLDQSTNEIKGSGNIVEQVLQIYQDAKASQGVVDCILEHKKSHKFGDKGKK